MRQPTSPSISQKHTPFEARKTEVRLGNSARHDVGCQIKSRGISEKRRVDVVCGGFYLLLERKKDPFQQ